ncbi:hypothetical protein EVAR_39047_1 [Eumeta japonica]|uniref:Uncharacterized protein n=1 Tax=Eumeta variegata TaxID=151549 RepID=A0A4C1WQY8_EUMVA|nr:hypothetical protein EVAR_39047_1 [Eumeta japonica]
MDSNSVSPMPELAPIAEFDKSPPSPPNEEVPMDDLPPPPATVCQPENKKNKLRVSGFIYSAVEVRPPTIFLLGLSPSRWPSARRGSPVIVDAKAMISSVARSECFNLT